MDDLEKILGWVFTGVVVIPFAVAFARVIYDSIRSENPKPYDNINNSTYNLKK
jgi:hypothetical protein